METNKKLQGNGNGDEGGKQPQPLPGELKQTPAPEIPQLPNNEVPQMRVTPQEPPGQGSKQSGAA